MVTTDKNNIEMAINPTSKPVAAELQGSHLHGEKSIDPFPDVKNLVVPTARKNSTHLLQLGASGVDWSLEEGEAS